MTDFSARSETLPGLTSPVGRFAWLIRALGVLLLLGGLWGLGGCASTSTSAGVNTSTGTGTEPITESDEPEGRKRARLRLELAAGYFEQGQTSVALDQIKQSLAADASFGPAYSLRGLVYMRLNEPALAEESFRRALQINPRDADAMHNYGVFLCQQQRFAEGVGLFRRALSNPLYANQAKTLMMQGTCQLRMGQAPEAEASFSRSYELDPANPYVGYNLANLEYLRGEFTKAQFVIRRINNSEQANSETLWLGIKIERRLNNVQVVGQLAQQLQRRFPRSKEWASYQRGAFNE